MLDVSAVSVSRSPSPLVPDPPAPGARAGAAAAGPIEEAMERFAAGELAAFTRVYTMTMPIVRRGLVRLCRQPALADDLAQETLLRMFRARTRWRPGARVLPWARAIARRLLLDRIRQRQREQAAFDRLAQHSALNDGEPPADQHVAARRMAAQVAQAVERLPASQRAAFRLLGEHGLSIGEAARALGESNVAVRVRLHRARRSLAAALAGP